MTLETFDHGKVEYLFPFFLLFCLFFCPFVNLFFLLFVFLSRYHSDQKSEGSQVPKDTLCVQIVKWRSVSRHLKGRYRAVRAAKDMQEREEITVMMIVIIARESFSTAGNLIC